MARVRYHVPLPGPFTVSGSVGGKGKPDSAPPIAGLAVIVAGLALAFALVLTAALMALAALLAIAAIVVGMVYGQRLAYRWIPVARPRIESWWHRYHWQSIYVAEIRAAAPAAASPTNGRELAAQVFDTSIEVAAYARYRENFPQGGRLTTPPSLQQFRIRPTSH